MNQMLERLERAEMLLGRKLTIFLLPAITVAYFMAYLFSTSSGWEEEGKYALWVIWYAVWFMAAFMLQIGFIVLMVDILV